MVISHSTQCNKACLKKGRLSMGVHHACFRAAKSPMGGGGGSSVDCEARGRTSSRGAGYRHTYGLYVALMACRKLTV